MKHPEYLLIGLLGGLSLELLQLHIYKGRITEQKYRKLLTAPLFWFCTGALVLGAGIVAWGLNADQDNQRIIDVFVTGIAARSIVRELLTAKNVTAPTKLGGEQITQKDVFV
jgi:hypothetical protein